MSDTFADIGAELIQGQMRQKDERIAELEDQLAAAEAAGDRWKIVRDRLWIRNQVSLAGGEPRPALEVIIGCAFMDRPPKAPGRGDELDAAIDAARKQATAPEQEGE